MERFKGVVTADDSFALQVATSEPSLFSLAKRCQSKQPVILQLVAQIEDVNHFLNQGTPLSGDEIMFIAENLYTEYKYLFTFADITIIMRNAKMGKYGKLYNRLSSPDIFEWFSKYQLEKDSAATRYRDEESKAFTHTPIRLGYHFDEQGRFHLDTPKKEDSATVPSSSAAGCLSPREQKEQEYLAVKREQQYRSILAKPEDLRTPSEKDFLTLYQNTPKP